MFPNLIDHTTTKIYSDNGELHIWLKIDKKSLSKKKIEKKIVKIFFSSKFFFSYKKNS